MAVPLTDQAIAKIKERIISGQFRPGSKLPREQDLARELGLSRNSLREAIRAEMRRFFRKRSGRRPLVLPIVMEI